MGDGDLEQSASERPAEPHAARWDRDGTARVTAEAADPQDALLEALRGLLALATGERPEAGEDGGTAAPIRGEGSDLGRLFVALANDLLRQLDSLGVGFREVRLDGMLETDDGGYTAWGYLVGDAGDPRPLAPLTIAGEPEVRQDAGGQITLRCVLRRE